MIRATFRPKEVYGKELYYPVNDEAKALMEVLTGFSGKKTLPGNINTEAFAKLGIEVVKLTWAE